MAGDSMLGISQTTMLNGSAAIVTKSLTFMISMRHCFLAFVSRQGFLFEAAPAPLQKLAQSEGE